MNSYTASSSVAAFVKGKEKNGRDKRSELPINLRRWVSFKESERNLRMPHFLQKSMGLKDPQLNLLAVNMSASFTHVKDALQLPFNPDSGGG